LNESSAAGLVRMFQDLKNDETCLQAAVVEDKKKRL
jgi:hypothetical protein